MPTNSLKQNILIPQRQLPNGSKNVEHDMGKKKNFMNQLRAMVRKRFSFCQKTRKKLKLHSDSPPNPVISKENASSSKQRLLPRTTREFSYPKVFPKLKRKLSQNGNLPTKVTNMTFYPCCFQVHCLNTCILHGSPFEMCSMVAAGPVCGTKW